MKAFIVKQYCFLSVNHKKNRHNESLTSLSNTSPTFKSSFFSSYFKTLTTCCYLLSQCHMTWHNVDNLYLSGMWFGVGVQRRGERCPERSQVSVSWDLWPAKGATGLLLQPGVLQEAGGAEEGSPEKHGRVGENVHKPRQRDARRGRWRRSRKRREQREQAVIQVRYIL